MIEGIVLASASRTATTAARLPDNLEGYRGVMLVIDVTTTPGAETLTLQLEWGYASGNSSAWEPLTAFGTVTGNGQYVYIIYPGAVETAAIADQQVSAIPIPFRTRINITHSSTGAWVYAVSYTMLP